MVYDDPLADLRLLWARSRELTVQTRDAFRSSGMDHGIREG